MDDDKTPDAFAQAMRERRNDPRKVAMSLPDDFATRPFGGVLLALAALDIWLYTYNPIAEARAHATTIDRPGFLVYATPIFLVLGVIYTLFGAKASRVLGPTTRPSTRGRILWGVLLLLCVGYWLALKTYLRQLGYAV